MEQLKRIAAAKKFKKNLKLQAQRDDSDSDASLTSDDEEEVSKNIVGKFFNNRYYCLKYLGRGTFSRVWLVYDLQECEYRAMKANFSEFYEDAIHEIKVMKKINNIGNPDSKIVKMYDYFVDGKSMCIIYELMGKCLLDIFRKYEDKTIPLDFVKKVIRDILKGLSEAHQKNIIHTDLKPENIMLNQYSPKIQNIMNWFTGLEPYQDYSIMANEFLPENYEELPGPKKKTYRKKAKNKARSKFMIKYKDLLIKYNQENPDSNFESDSDSNTNISEPDLIEINTDSINPVKTNTDFDDLELLENQELQELQELQEVNIEDTNKIIEKRDNNQNSDNIDFDLSNLTVKLVDFGNGEFGENLIQEEIGLRSYRCPENIMNEHYDTKSDIWVVGCIAYELITGEYLFDIEKLTKSIDRDRQHLHQMYEVLGKMPKDLALCCDYTEDLFDNKGRILKNKEFDTVCIEDILVTEFNYSDEYAEKTSDFLLKMLEYDPKKRYSAQQCLSLKWLN